MVVHESTTNPVKHGALSTDTGILEISATNQNDLLEIVWTETGGPAVDKKPELQGFDSKMIAKAVEAELDGTIYYDWQSAGFVAKVTASSDLLSS